MMTDDQFLAAEEADVLDFLADVQEALAFGAEQEELQILIMRARDTIDHLVYMDSKGIPGMLELCIPYRDTSKTLMDLWHATRAAKKARRAHG